MTGFAAIAAFAIVAGFFAVFRSRVAPAAQGGAAATEALQRRELSLRERELKLVQQESALVAERRELEEALGRVGELTRSQAREDLLKRAEASMKGELEDLKLSLLADADREAKARWTETLAAALPRIASKVVESATITVVPLPSDSLKGRIVGREGRNIRTFERATGVDLIVDDTPELVTLSSFNPRRREIARVALEALLADGRIHPASIEESVANAGEEIEASILGWGRECATLVGVEGLGDELLSDLGALRLHVVEGTTLLDHSVVVARACRAMAAGIGADVDLATRAGLLHDIGQLTNAASGDHHADAGARLCRSAGEPEAVVLAVAESHALRPSSVLGILLNFADRLVRSRPGAGDAGVDVAVERNAAVEAVAQGFEGVERAYALQAGRDLQVVVNYAAVDDQRALLLSSEIARQIERAVTFPGEIRVTVVREARATEVAT